MITLNIDSFISQAITWLKELGDVMITSHTNVGRTFEEAGRMKADHEKFQNTAKVFKMCCFFDAFCSTQLTTAQSSTCFRDQFEQEQNG